MPANTIAASEPRPRTPISPAAPGRSKVPGQLGAADDLARAGARVAQGREDPRLAAGRDGKPPLVGLGRPAAGQEPDHVERGEVDEERGLAGSNGANRSVTPTILIRSAWPELVIASSSPTAAPVRSRNIREAIAPRCDGATRPAAGTSCRGTETAEQRLALADRHPVRSAGRWVVGAGRCVAVDRRPGQPGCAGGDVDRRPPCHRPWWPREVSTPTRSAVPKIAIGSSTSILISIASIASGGVGCRPPVFGSSRLTTRRCPARSTAPVADRVRNSADRRRAERARPTDRRRPAGSGRRRPSDPPRTRRRT